MERVLIIVDKKAEGTKSRHANDEYACMVITAVGCLCRDLDHAVALDVNADKLDQ